MRSTLILLTSVVLSACCCGGPPPDPLDPEEMLQTYTVWQALRNDSTQFNNWSNMELTFNRDLTYTTSNSHDTTLWKSSGKWQYRHGEILLDKRHDGYCYGGRDEILHLELNVINSQSLNEYWSFEFKPRK